MEHIKKFDDFILEKNTKDQEANIKKEKDDMKKKFMDKNVPKGWIKNSIKYWAIKKLNWNKKELNLDKDEIEYLTYVQQLTHKYHPEFDYLFSVGKKEVQDELLKHED